ncbi:hypothetical protein Scep_018941 [Stephania cephalantha]|uniref:Uncharacterized protein n=1 Tax=Stephania cephalantha TaxID=152367 RepID=A0AAP0IA26_9MAGN
MADKVDHVEEALDRNSKAKLWEKLELGLVPDEEIKVIMRSVVEKRHQWINKLSCQQQQAQILKLVHSLRQTDVVTESTYNPDHYEIAFSFMKIMHGKALKMSWSYFEDESVTLDDAEIAMLDLYCERAQISDGHKVLDLGCGYGAVALHIARKYPHCHVTAITDIASQKQFIEEQCREHNLANVEIILADITTYEMNKEFDRVMVISVLEHLKNYELFLRKTSKWMKADGFLFIEHWCHRSLAYEFKASSNSHIIHIKPLVDDDRLEDWIFPDMTVVIPSFHLLLYFQDDVSIINHWIIDGNHFSRSHEEWLKNIDANIDAAKAAIVSSNNSEEEAMKWFNHWRTSLFHGIEQGKYNNGEAWMVAHLLFKKK